MAEVDWSLLKPLPNFFETYTKAYETGLDLGRQGAIRNAMRDYATNPQGTVDQLIRVGAIPEAAALGNLGYQQQQRAVLSEGMRRLLHRNAITDAPQLDADPASPAAQAAAATSSPGGPAPPPSIAVAGGGRVSAAAGAGPSAPPAPPGAPVPEMPDVSTFNDHQLGHVHGVADTLDALAIELRGLPYPQRRARLAQEAQALIASGLPEEQVRNFDPTDQALMDIHRVTDEIRGLVPRPGSPGAAAPAAAAQPSAHGDAAPWLDLRNPDTQETLGMMSLGGAEVGPLVSIGTATMPKYASTRGGLVFDEHTGRFTNAAPGENGVQFDLDAHGNVVGSHEVPGYTEANARREGAIAGAKASAEEGGRAPYHVVEVDMPDGTKMQGTMVPDASGHVRFQPLQAGAAAQGGGLGGGASGGSGAGGTGVGFGRSQSPGAHTVAVDQAGQAVALLKPDPVLLNEAVDTEATAQRALAIIGSMRFDQTTPWKVQAANILRSMPGISNTAWGRNLDQYATSAAAFQAIATQALASGAHSAFPQRTTDRDIKLMKDVFPSLTTPNDQAALAMGTQAAQARRTQAWEEFKANYGGDRTDPNAVYRAWLSGPGGQSIFQSPVWARVSVGGRPAFNPATDIKIVKGHRVGAWGLGTGHPIYFPVQ